VIATMFRVPSRASVNADGTTLRQHAEVEWTQNVLLAQLCITAVLINPS